MVRRRMEKALGDAVIKGNLQEVEKLIEAKTDIHAEVTGDVDFDSMFPEYEYTDGMAPIFVAAQLGHTKITEALVKAGAKIDGEAYIGCGSGPRGRRRLQAIHLAAGMGRTKTVEALVELNADVSARAEVSIDGHPGDNIEYPGYDCPIHFAADYGHAETVEALVRLNADVESRASYEIERFNSHEKYWDLFQEMEPIHIAAWRGHVQVVRTLVSLGASVEAEGSMEQSGPERHIELKFFTLISAASGMKTLYLPRVLCSVRAPPCENLTYLSYPRVCVCVC